MTRDEIKAQLRQEFPGWSILTTDHGRWWANRHIPAGERIGPRPDVDFVDTPEQLRDQLLAIVGSS